MSVVAVIDIGMTNKKVALYDRRLSMLECASRSFPALVEEGLAVHDLSGIERWFLDTLSDMGTRHPIRAIAVATHGATVVCVGDDGGPCAPCVLYTHEPGPAFHDRFYTLAGNPNVLQEATGTPALSALINSAKGIFFLQERFPGRFARTRLVLGYPQYWGFRLTGIAGAEGTYTGCHSYLWDWKKELPSSVAEALGIEAMLPMPLKESWAVLGTLRPEIAARTGLSPDTAVTMGIHDSNASLLPHMAFRAGSDFILNSTGTWCVLMHPQKRYGFARSELGKMVFFNRSALNTPVKTAIFLGGRELDTWSGLFESARGTHPAADPVDDDYRAVIGEKSVFILPEIVPGSGQFPGSTPRAVEDGKEYPLSGMQDCAPAFFRQPTRARAALDLSLVIQTTVALERIGLGQGTEVFTEGGFRNNASYNALLAAALPANKVFLTDIAEATSFGAAMTAVAALEQVPLESLRERFRVEYVPVAPLAGLEGFPAYRRAWLKAVGKEAQEE
jgi:L-fuculokinase